MALQRDARYPGRWLAPSPGHPQGAFKNRTAPGALDGSYIEQDWANDWDGFFSSLLNTAGATPNGNVDAVGASQYFSALQTMLNRTSAPVGASLNVKATIGTASSSMTLTADEIVVGTALGGITFKVTGVAHTIVLTNVGLNGMDVGSPPANGWVAVYEIFNPVTGVKGLLGRSVGNAVAAPVYAGANMPAGFTASALLTVLPTNGSSQFKPLQVWDKRVYLVLTSAFSGNASVVNNPISIASIVPANAKEIINGELSIANTAASAMSLTVFPDGATIFGQQNLTALISAGAAMVASYARVPIVVAQQMAFTSSSSAGTPTYIIYIGGYSL